MAPKSNKSRRQQTITYNLSNANARDAFEEELELEEAELQQRHTGRARHAGRGSAAFSLSADMPPSHYVGDMSGMHEYSSPEATADIINLLELFGTSLDREVIESVYLGCNSKFELAMERLLELAASNGPGTAGGPDGISGLEAGGGGDGGDGAATSAAAAAQAFSPATDPSTASSANGVCYWDLLPDDLKRHVFSFLNSRDLARVARTCWDFAGPARSLRTNTRQLQIPTGLGMHGIMAMVAGHPNARAISLRQWASAPLTEADFTALVVALSAGSRSARRLVPVEAVSFKGCRWLSDGQVMAVCQTMQHLKEVDLTDCVGITDAALVALSKYQRMSPEGDSSSSSSSDGEYDVVQSSAAATLPPPPGVMHQPGLGLREQQSCAGGGGDDDGAAPRRGDDDDDGDGDAELQFEFDATPVPSKRPEGPSGRACVVAAGGPLAVGQPAGMGPVASTEGNADGEEEEEDARVRGGSSSSSGSDDEVEEEREGKKNAAEGERGGEDVDGHARGAGGARKEEEREEEREEENGLRGAFTATLELSSPIAAVAKPRKGSGGGGGGRAATGAVAARSPPPAGMAAAMPSSDSGRARSGTLGGDSTAGPQLYGSSPVAGGGLMGTSYGATRGGGAASSWLYGTSPSFPGSGGGGAAAAAMGTKSWLYGSSPVMGASPYFRTSGSANITHNGWLARAATTATNHQNGCGLMSINLSGCSAISSDGVKALLSARLPKDCLLQLDISRCPRITRAALVLPATSNLCVLRASACHNLHEVIMQLPLTSPLTELHLADCKALTKLHVVAPALQQLHVGSCRRLTQLHLRCPQLRHLTASLCFRLVEFDTERWEVGRLEHLNLFGCRHLEWPGLAALLAKCGSSLRHLDVNGCNALVVADIPAGNDGLRHLDASGCKSLMALRCSSPALATLALRSCPRLQEVVLESAALTRLDISNCPHLQGLTMPALHQQQQLLQQQQGQDGHEWGQGQGQLGQQQAPGGASGNRTAMAPVGALRAAMSGAEGASTAGRAAGGGGTSGIDGGGGGCGGRNEGVMVRMAGCDRLPVEIAVLLRRLREKAKQHAAAALAGTAATAGRAAAGQSRTAP